MDRNRLPLSSKHVQRLFRNQYRTLLFCGLVACLVIGSLALVEIDDPYDLQDVVVCSQDAIWSEEGFSLESSPKDEESVQIGQSIRQVLSKQVPEGYICVCPIQDGRYLKKGVIAETLSRFDRSCESIYLYRVLNTSHQMQAIYEQQLKIPGTRWVYLQKQFLKPQESVFAVMGVSR